MRAGAGSSAESADERLIPSLVSLVVAPALARALRGAWDAGSASATAAALAAVGDVLDFEPPRDTVQALLAAALVALASAAAALCVPVLVRTGADGGVPGGLDDLTLRQFMLGVKLARNAVAWRGRIADGALRPLVMDALVAPLLTPVVDSARAAAAAAAAAGDSTAAETARAHCMTCVQLLDQVSAAWRVWGGAGWPARVCAARVCFAGGVVARRVGIPRWSASDCGGVGTGARGARRGRGRVATAGRRRDAMRGPRRRRNTRVGSSCVCVRGCR